MTLTFPKHPRLHNPAWIRTVRQMPCVFRGTIPSEAAHVSWNSGRGVAYKADDNRLVPLHPELHRMQGDMPEAQFWHEHLKKSPRFYDQCAKAWASAFKRGEISDIALPASEHAVEMVVAWSHAQYDHFIRTGRALWQ